VIANLVQSWAKDIRQHRPEVGEHLAKNFGDNMFGGDYFQCQPRIRAPMPDPAIGHAG